MRKLLVEGRWALLNACITSLFLCLLLSVLIPPFSYHSRHLVLLLPLPPSRPPSSSLPPAAGTTASSNAGAMNSLTSLGTLQGLAGATVGLNNINALAGSINSEYSPCHRPLHPHLHLRPSTPNSDMAATTCESMQRDAASQQR